MAGVYITPDGKKILLTNQRCASTSISRVAALDRPALLLEKSNSNFYDKSNSFHEEKFFSYLNPDTKIYIIVRNPYERLMSFHRMVNEKIEDPNATWNTVINDFGKERISFSDFVKKIKDGYHDPHHMTPQSNIYNAYKSRAPNNKFSIIKMEENLEDSFKATFLSHESMPTLCHLNASEPERVSISISDKKFIYKKYEEDFKNFNYNKYENTWERIRGLFPF